MSYTRFAIYYVPPNGPLAEFGASWLGWDVSQGREAPQFHLPDLDDIAMTPRKYGFHGTLKPPFRLAGHRTLPELEAATSKLAARLAPAVCDGLDLTMLGSFLALTPRGDTTALQRIAETAVCGLDAFRAPATDGDLAKRRKAGLSTRQDALLTRWGYPYVMEEFRFHMTLSGRLPKHALPAWAEIARRHLPDLPSPFMVDQIALCAEREDGRFEVIHRYTLTA